MSAGPDDVPVRWSPVVLVRIGGLPVDAVPMSRAEINECLDRVAAADGRLASLSQPLVDQLFEAVPLAGDAALRRAVLKAKRAVFGGQKISAEVHETVSRGVSRETAAQLDAWYGCLCDRDRLLDQLASMLREDEEAMRSGLLATLSDGDYLSSLALAAPGFVAKVVAKEHQMVYSDRLARTLYNYCTRTALKTSPFSGLTTVNLHGQRGRGRAVLAVARHLATGLLEQTVHDGRPHPALRLKASPLGIHGADGHEKLALVPNYVHQDGIIYREETVIGAEWVAQGHPEVFVAGTLTTRTRRHVEAGVLRVEVPWGREDDPFPVLAGNFPEGIAGIGATEILGIGAASIQCAERDAATRVAALSELADSARRIFPDEALGERPGGILYEDREGTDDVPDLLAVPDIRNDLEDLGRLMGPWVYRSHLYDLMVNRFVGLHGRGGTCTSPLSFFMAMAVENDGDEEVMLAQQMNWSATAEQARERSLMPCGRSAVTRHLGVMLQVAAPSWQAADLGDHLTVVNSVGNGAGAYGARFHRLFGTEYRDALASSIRSMWQAREVLELTVWAECNTGQAVSSGVLPELQLPGEPVSARGLALERLFLRHDPETDSLELWDHDGPVGLAYLGLTPQHLLTGYLRWVAMVADPWVRFPPYCDTHTSTMAGFRRIPNGTVQYEPRESVGRSLVTRRESWYCTMQTLTELGTADSVAAVRAWYDFRRCHGIPPIAFVQQATMSGGTTNDRHKPQFVDFGSPTSLSSLEHWLDSDTRIVRISEALPAPGMHPQLGSDGRARVSELAVSLCWDGDGR